MTDTSIHKNDVFSTWNIFKLILALGLAIFVFSKTDRASIVATFKSVSLFWLAVSGVLFLFLTLLKTLQYYVLLRNEMTYWQVLNVIVWQNAVTNFLLAGAGIATYITMAHAEHRIQVRQSVVTFLLIKIGDLTAIWLALLISSSLVWTQIRIIQTPVVILLTGIGLTILVFFLTVVFRQRFVSTLNRVLDRLGISQIKVIQRGVLFLQSLANMKQEKVIGSFVMLLLCSVLYFAVTLVWMYSNLATFHLRVDVAAVVFVGVLMQLVSYFPVYVFGGIGITETSALYFWSFFQISQELLAPALIGIRVIFYLFNLIPLIYLPVYAVIRNPKEQTTK